MEDNLVNVSNFKKYLNLYIQRKYSGKYNKAIKTSAKDRLKEKFASMKQKYKTKILGEKSNSSEQESLNSRDKSDSIQSQNDQNTSYLGKIKSLYKSEKKGDYMERLRLYYKTKKEKFYNKKETFQHSFQIHFAKIFDEREKTKLYKTQTKYSLLFLFTLSNIYFTYRIGRFSYLFFAFSGLFFINMNIMINYQIKSMYKKKMKELRKEFFKAPNENVKEDDENKKL